MFHFAVTRGINSRTRTLGHRRRWIPNVADRVRALLETLGPGPPERLAALDHFHVRGADATAEALACRWGWRGRFEIEAERTARPPTSLLGAKDNSDADARRLPEWTHFLASDSHRFVLS